VINLLNIFGKMDFYYYICFKLKYLIMINTIKLTALFLLFTNVLVSQEDHKESLNIAISDFKEVPQYINNEDIIVILKKDYLNLQVLRDTSDTPCTRTIKFNKLYENDDVEYNSFTLKIYNNGNKCKRYLDKGFYELVFIKKTINGVKTFKKRFKVL